MDRLDGRRVLLGVGGSIAAYKSIELIRELRARGATVKVAPTKAALEFIGALTFEAISGEPILGRALEIDGGRIPHVEEGYAADLAVIAPASADLLAKMAHGLADEGLLATLLSYTGPLVVAPAMESRMWDHPATRANVATLVERGALLVGPVDGALASGRSGKGRFAPVDDILEAALAALVTKDLDGRRVVVTAGPSVEDIDPVRFISNRSSGKMGVAIARAAAQRGAHVTLVHGPLSVEIPHLQGLTPVPVRSAAELRAAVFDVVERGCDVAILSAAVADFRPSTIAGEKIKKGASETMTLTLTRTDDTLAALGARADRPFLVGFAAETNDVVSNAQRKLIQKNCDLVCANDVSEAGVGFGSDQNRVTLLTKDDPAVALPVLSKHAVADRILDHVARALFVRASFKRHAPENILVEKPRVVVSRDCGGYWCEHTYFVGGEAARARSGRMGFLHVPADDEAFGVADGDRAPIARHTKNREIIGAFVRGMLDDESAPSRLLLTGFGPFKTVVKNPSGEFVSSIENLRVLFQTIDPHASVHVLAGDFPLAIGAHADLEIALPARSRTLRVRVAHLPVDERAVNARSGTALADLIDDDTVVLALGVASMERDVWRVELRATDVNLRENGDRFTRENGAPATRTHDEGLFVGDWIRSGLHARSSST
jgi:phosphopantothenoylcysteine decarboxylase/phosphopantothenate--cysteine ligase